jgi:hypothetical protein
MLIYQTVILYEEAITMRLFMLPQASVQASIIAKQKCNYYIDQEIIEKILRIYYLILKHNAQKQWLLDLVHKSKLPKILLGESST